MTASHSLYNSNYLSILFVKTHVNVFSGLNCISLHNKIYFPCPLHKYLEIAWLLILQACNVLMLFAVNDLSVVISFGMYLHNLKLVLFFFFCLWLLTPPKFHFTPCHVSRCCLRFYPLNCLLHSCIQGVHCLTLHANINILWIFSSTQNQQFRRLVVSAALLVTVASLITTYAIFFNNIFWVLCDQSLMS